MDEPEDKCMNGRCWTGPLMIVETEKGAIGDLCVALKLFLAKHFGKEMAQAMRDELSFSHCHEERTILGHAVGREPAGAILREICALIEIHNDSVIQTRTGTYRFKLLEQSGVDTFSKLLVHYQWLASVDRRKGHPDKDSWKAT